MGALAAVAILSQKASSEAALRLSPPAVAESRKAEPRAEEVTEVRSTKPRDRAFASGTRPISREQSSTLLPLSDEELQKAFHNEKIGFSDALRYFTQQQDHLNFDAWLDFFERNASTPEQKALHALLLMRKGQNKAALDLFEANLLASEFPHPLILSAYGDLLLEAERSAEALPLYHEALRTLDQTDAQMRATLLAKIRIFTPREAL